MTRLHELYQEMDALWAELMAIPIEARQAYKTEHRTEDNPYPDMPEAEAIMSAMDALRKQISPLEKDFEEDFSNALADRINDDAFAVLAYGCLCNVQWEHDDGSRYSCSWRSAGAIVAEIRDKGEDYMSFYCSGGEGRVDEEIEEAMAQLGWHPDPTGL